MPLVSATALTRLTCRILEAAGTPEAIAANVAGMLVGSNLAGHDSHGVLRIPQYLVQVEKGTLVPAEQPEVLRQTAATALVDARRGWGHHAADYAMTLAMEKAAEAGSCTVVLRRCNHIGRLGEFVERAAARGFLSSVSMGSGGRGAGLAAPFGGSERALGTNPIAFGIPTGDDTPFAVDFATTVVAEGKIQVARSKGQPVPPGCVLDREGQPTTDPAAFYDGGSMLFAGGYKGYGLSLHACLTAMLNGQFQPMGWRIGGVVIQALHPAAFIPADEYREAVRDFLAGIKSVPPGAEGGEVLYPGEPEKRMREQRLVSGIEVPDTIWEEIRVSAAGIGVAIDEEAGG